MQNGSWLTILQNRILIGRQPVSEKKRSEFERTLRVCVGRHGAEKPVSGKKRIESGRHCEGEVTERYRIV